MIVHRRYFAFERIQNARDFLSKCTPIVNRLSRDRYQRKKEEKLTIVFLTQVRILLVTRVRCKGYRGGCDRWRTMISASLTNKSVISPPPINSINEISSVVLLSLLVAVSYVDMPGCEIMNIGAYLFRCNFHRKSLDGFIQKGFRVLRNLILGIGVPLSFSPPAPTNSIQLNTIFFSKLQFVITIL